MFYIMSKRLWFICTSVEARNVSLSGQSLDRSPLMSVLRLHGNSLRVLYRASLMCDSVKVVAGGEEGAVAGEGRESG